MSLMVGGGTWDISVKSNSYGFLFERSCKRANHSVAKLRRGVTHERDGGEGGAGGRQRISTHREGD